MKYLRIGNQGEMDIAALTLMGATSKENDSSKIGFFGSGNKYAIATLLRNNCGIRIFSGVTEYDITIQEVSFRGEQYQQILIAGQPTSLTTRLGPEWEVWMALREFYCNAMDEGLESFDAVNDIIALAGRTFIYVTITDQVQYFLNNIGDYINNYESLSSVNDIDILDSPDGHLYRKGICCSTEEKKSLFSYNFQNIQINESRIVPCEYMINEQIATALAGTTNETIITKYLDNCLDSSLLEYNARWDIGYCSSHLSPVWEELLIADGKSVISESLSSYIPVEDRQTCTILPDGLVEKIARELPNVPQYGHFDTESMSAEPSVLLKAKVEESIIELEKWGFENIVVVYRKYKSGSTMAQYKDGQIYLSVDISLEEVLTGLYEELIHKKTGFSDGSRSLQTYLVKQLIEANKSICQIRTANVS